MTGPDRFAKFLKDNEITLTAAATVFGVKPPTVFEWRAGTRCPRSEHRAAIERWTDGFVTADSWLDEEKRSALEGIRPFAAPEAAR